MTAKMESVRRHSRDLVRGFKGWRGLLTLRAAAGTLGLVALIFGLAAALTDYRRHTLTMARLARLDRWCEQYHHRFGRYPGQVGWYRALWDMVLGDQDFLDDDNAEVFRTFYDAWGNSIRYRCPGIHNPDSFDLFMVGREPALRHLARDR